MSPSVCFFNYLQDMCINHFAYLIPWLSTLRMRNAEVHFVCSLFLGFPVVIVIILAHSRSTT